VGLGFGQKTDSKQAPGLKYRRHGTHTTHGLVQFLIQCSGNDFLFVAPSPECPFLNREKMINTEIQLHIFNIFALQIQLHIFNIFAQVNFARCGEFGGMTGLGPAAG
jgi:hypothetical protein